MSKVKVLIASWGNPWSNFSKSRLKYESLRWDEVKYVINDKELMSRSSLPLLYDYIEPSKVIILVPDSVAYGHLSNYYELINKVRSMYEEFLDSTLKFNPGKHKVDIAVTPSVGNYDNCLFDCDIPDFKVYVLYYIAEVLNELISEVSNDIHETNLEIHLDLTHGVNYMPTLTYSVVNDIATILSVFSNVRLMVYNSEPYSKGVDVLRIHVVEDRSTFNWPIYMAVNHKSLFRKRVKLKVNESRFLDERIRCMLGSKLENLKSLHCIAASIQYGLPLIIYEFFIEDILKIGSSLINIYRDYIAVNYDSGSNKLRVFRRLGLTNDAYNLLKMWFTALMLNHLSPYIKIKVIKDVDIELLKLTTKGIFRKNTLLVSKISRDLHEIESNVKKLGRHVHSWIPYETLVERPGKVDRRNFVAHSGLLSRHIEVKPNETCNNIYIRHVDSAKNELIKLCEDSLKM
ncbi:MAG: TIGR01897 family CRISPR-associated protein [Thermoprotei archaeon]|nr:MAG: TIGR01897 family CRISPR-associated protein [Thermoprotei archaeon]